MNCVTVGLMMCKNEVAQSLKRAGAVDENGISSVTQNNDSIA
jgi:hypothetical protein